MNESCHTYEWVMSHWWMNHVTLMNESCHTHLDLSGENKAKKEKNIISHAAIGQFEVRCQYTWLGQRHGTTRDSASKTTQSGTLTVGCHCVPISVVGGKKAKKLKANKKKIKPTHGRCAIRVWLGSKVIQRVPMIVGWHRVEMWVTAEKRKNTYIRPLRASGASW